MACLSDLTNLLNILIVVDLLLKCIRISEALIIAVPIVLEIFWLSIEGGADKDLGPICSMFGPFAYCCLHSRGCLWEMYDRLELWGSIILQALILFCCWIFKILLLNLRWIGSSSSDCCRWFAVRRVCILFCCLDVLMVAESEMNWNFFWLLPLFLQVPATADLLFGCWYLAS